MTSNPFKLALLAGLLFSLPTFADNMDKKLDKSSVMPTAHENSQLTLEHQRAKKKLQALKMKRHPTENAVVKAAANTRPLVNIEMVELPIGIMMGKYEVTQGQWQAVMGNNPSFFSSCGNNCPVEQVSWDDVQGFIQRLNSQTGADYRLPTEDEWFRACQAGSDNIDYCGSNSLDAVAWYSGNSNDITHAVGQKQPNAWNLYDMSGNIWEWTSSCWEGDCPSGCDDRTCRSRVGRGGSWDDFPTYVRSTYPFWNDTSHRFNTLGFRLAQDR